tara:strand:- start:676 stop:1902 length:1227 start_codon:yes stop_codon:yes gene_type:complete
MAFDGTNKPLNNERLKDYQHAGRTFTDANFRLAPKQKFLFYVVFNYSPLATLTISDEIKNETSMLVKAVDLPTYTFDTQNLNQYNRWRAVQTKINYNPIQIRFHDDQSNITKRLWYSYLDYYYDDQKNGDVDHRSYSSQSNIYSNESGASSFSSKSKWGMSTPKSERFFTNIKIYSIYGQKKFSEYTLINPIITQFNHDSHDHSQSDILENSMQLQYETVKYATGTMGGGRGEEITNGPKGFGSLHYDKTVGPLPDEMVFRDFPNFKDEHLVVDQSQLTATEIERFEVDQSAVQGTKDERLRWSNSGHRPAMLTYNNQFANEHKLDNPNQSKALAKAKNSNTQHAFPSAQTDYWSTRNSSGKYPKTTNTQEKTGPHQNTTTVINEDGSKETFVGYTSEPMSGPWDREK